MPTSGADSAMEERLLRLLSRSYPTITAAHIEMINLNAILALPKGTDHYISDIHGAYDQFDHILRHASGAIRRIIGQTFGDELPAQAQIDLALLVYYPAERLQQALAAAPGDPAAWLEEAIVLLVRVARTAARKYTRSKVRRRLDPRRAYILEELLTESGTEVAQKVSYYQSIVRSIVALDEGPAFVVTLAELIQNLVVDRLHIIGDIYDRGPAAERVMARLMAHHSVSIQWGNHDVSWMGAASGCPALVANVVRIALRYGSLETLLDGYGIDLRPLARLADAVYADDPCAVFQPKSDLAIEGYSPGRMARMHKAIAIMQLKLEAQIIRRHPEYAMDDRLLLDGIDLAAGTAAVDGVSYPLLDTRWPTLDPADTARLSAEEAAALAELREQFRSSARLQEHMRFLYAYGGMFQVHDGNLKFHGCLPVDERGGFIAVPLGGKTLAGPALLARCERMAREAFFSRDPAAAEAGQDVLWYLWCGQNSPLYGRQRMTTFERYFIADPATHAEPKGAYYALRHDEAFCRAVLRAFGGDPERGYIINGHTPVRLSKGERPLLANGRMVVIDGGLSEAYQPVTGIAGYTLIGSSNDVILAAHEPFSSVAEMLATGADPTPQTERIARFPERMLIAATDTGAALRGQLEDLAKLIQAYRQGLLVERA
ncbi:MAG TPA: fructose-1,6-bisphosphatase [Herpetosiphonaceae bacterium]|nr:fructose-1,6-bisphosphatase [Herpetosiphonaceae bacterium]